MTLRLHWAAVLIVIALAAFLRLGYPGINPFASDEARLSVLALEMGRDGHLIRTGISNSAGSRNLPASVYVFVPPYVISTDPLVATQYVGILNVLGIIGIWWVIRRGLGKWGTLIALLYLAAAPFAVFFSRNIWTQNLLFPMAAGWLVAVFIALTTENTNHRRVAVAVTAFLAGFAFQVHLAGASLILATGYVFLRWRWWRQITPVLIGAGIALVALLPFLYEAACCSPELIHEYSAASGQSTVDMQVVQLAAQTAVNQGWDYLAAGDLARYGDVALTQLLSAGLLLLGVVGFVRVFFQRQSVDSQTRLLLELALVLLIAPILLFLYHRAPVRLHYLLTMLPALAVLTGLSVEVLRRNLWHIAMMGVAVILAGFWSNQIVASLNLVSQQAAPQGMHTPLKAVRDVAYSLPDNGRVVVMHTQSPDYYQRGEPAIWKVLFWNRPHRITNGWTQLLLPDEPAYLMTEIDGIHAWQEMRDTGIMDERLIRYDPLAGAQPLYMQPYDGHMQPPQTILLDEPIRFDTGLLLLGWYTRHVDGQVRVSMLYEALADPLADPSIRQFTHLRYAADVEAGNIDVPTYNDDIELTQTWQPGDHLIAIAAMTPREDAATFYVDIGHYSLNTGQRFYNSSGSDYLRLGPFDWSR